MAGGLRHRASGAGREVARVRAPTTLPSGPEAHGLAPNATPLRSVRPWRGCVRPKDVITTQRVAIGGRTQPQPLPHSTPLRSSLQRSLRSVPCVRAVRVSGGKQSLAQDSRSLAAGHTHDTTALHSTPLSDVTTPGRGGGFGGSHSWVTTLLPDKFRTPAPGPAPSALSLSPAPPPGTPPAPPVVWKTSGAGGGPGGGAQVWAAWQSSDTTPAPFRFRSARPAFLGLAGLFVLSSHKEYRVIHSAWSFQNNAHAKKAGRVSTPPPLRYFLVEKNTVHRKWCLSPAQEGGGGRRGAGLSLSFWCAPRRSPPLFRPPPPAP